MRKLIVLAALGGVSVGWLAGTAAAYAKGLAPGTFTEGRVLVSFEPGASPADRRETLERLGYDVVDGLSLPGAAVVRVDDTVPEAVSALERSSVVRYAEPERRYRLNRVVNDPFFNRLWGLDNLGQEIDGRPGQTGVDIDAPQAWDIATGGQTVVGVLDSGVAVNHPDIGPNLAMNGGEMGAGKETNRIDDDGNGYVDDVRGWDFVERDNDPTDSQGHGTHVAGTIAARGDNAVGVAGVAHDARILALRAGDEDGTLRTRDIVEGIDYARLRGVKVLNGSFGGYGTSQFIHDAITRASGMLFVFAAGNEDNDNDGDTPAYPCSDDAPNVLCVAAVDSDGDITSFSNYGLRSVDLVAPGRDIYSTGLARSAPVTKDTFDAGSATWSAGGSGSRWGVTGEAAASAPNSLSDSPGGGYADNSDTWARRQSPISLAGKKDCGISYDLRTETEPEFDYVSIEAAVPGGEWTELVADSGSSDGEFITGLGDLSAFDGAPNVYLMARLKTDDSVGGDGVWLDNVEVTCASDTYTGAELRSLDGTSMAAPHVAGVAALVLGQYPDASVDYVRKAILDGATREARLSQWVASGARLNARAALDADPPNGFDLAGPDSDIQTRERQPGLTWQSSADGKSGLRRYELVIDGSTVRNDISATSTNPPAPLPDGPHTWSVKAVDRAGNAVSSPTRTFVVDTAVPTLSVALSRRAKKDLRRRWLDVAVKTSEPVAGTLTVKARKPKGKRRKSRSKVIAQKALPVMANGRSVVRFALTKRQASRFRSALRTGVKRADLRLTLGVGDRAGNLAQLSTTRSIGKKAKKKKSRRKARRKR